MKNGWMVALAATCLLYTGCGGDGDNAGGGTGGSDSGAGGDPDASGTGGDPDAGGMGGDPDAGGMGGDADAGGTGSESEANILVFAASDDLPHSGGLSDTMLLYGAPVGEDGATDFAAAKQLSPGFIDGYDDWGDSKLRPQVSPDGKWVAWIGLEDSELYVRRADASSPERIVSKPEDIFTVLRFGWSPDSTALAFLEGDLRVAFVDGRASRTCALPIIGLTPPDFDEAFSWSPDRSFVGVALGGTDDDSDWVVHQFVCEVTGSGDPVDLTPTKGEDGFAFGPGGRVVYAAGGKVFVDDALGGDPTELGAGGLPKGNGSRFVWFNGSTIMTADWDGTGKKALSAATEVRGGRAWFNPTGDVVAFIDGETLRASAFDGSFDHSLTIVPDDYEDPAPTWSPDGARIALHGRVQGDLYVAETATAESAQVICTDGCATGRAWLDETTLLYGGNWQDQGTWHSVLATWSADLSSVTKRVGSASLSRAAKQAWPENLAGFGFALDRDSDLQALFDRHRPEGLVISSQHLRTNNLLLVHLQSPASGGVTGDVMMEFLYNSERKEWELTEIDQRGFFDYTPGINAFK